MIYHRGRLHFSIRSSRLSSHGQLLSISTLGVETRARHFLETHDNLALDTAYEDEQLPNYVAGPLYDDIFDVLAFGGPLNRYAHRPWSLFHVNRSGLHPASQHRHIPTARELFRKLGR